MRTEAADEGQGPSFLGIRTAYERDTVLPSQPVPVEPGTGCSYTTLPSWHSDHGRGAEMICVEEGAEIEIYFFSERRTASKT